MNEEDEIPNPEVLNQSTAGVDNSKTLSNRNKSRHYSAPISLKSGATNELFDSASTNTGNNQSWARRNRRAQTNMSIRNLGSASVKGAKSFRGITNAVTGVVVPTVKLSWREEIAKGGKKLSICAFASAFSLTLILNAMFLGSFSRIEFDSFAVGAADRVFDRFDGLEDLSFPLFAAGIGIIFFLYIFDFYYAPKIIKVVGFILFLIALVSIILGAFFLTAEDASAPIILIFFLVPVLLLIMKRLVFQDVDTKWYLFAIAVALIITTALTITGFVIWLIKTESYFTRDEVEETYFNFVGCNFTEKQLLGNNDTEELDDCPQAFIVYIMPVVVGAYSFLFANVLTFTIRADEKKKKGNLKKPIEPVAQAFIIAVVLGIVACWVLASLFANEIAQVTTEVLLLSLNALATILLIVFSVFGINGIKEKLIGSPLGIKVIEFSESQWVDGFIVFLLLPFVGGYLFLNLIIQTIRKKTRLGKPLHKTEDGVDEKDLLFAIESQWLVRRIAGWELGTLLYKVLIIGVIWFLFVIIVGRVVNVFLSFMSEVLVQLSLEVATVIFIAIGLGLFMLPPVPGLPIYLTAGVLLSKVAAEDENYQLEIGAAGAYAIVISGVIKMLSIVLQQKVIGQTLGANSVAIRSACQLNSLELRAMRKIMSVPGWTVPKVAVLVGGPDWPTSVLTGLMRLPLCQMLLGSIPVLLTIIPVCYAGAVLIEGEDGDLAELNFILLSVSLVVQLTPFFIAIHYIAKAAIDYHDELEAEELDQEVLAYDEKNKEKREWFVYLTEWRNLSMLGKVSLVIFSALMIISNMGFTFQGDQSFESFEVTDTIADRLDGNVFNLVTDFGRALLGIYIVALLYLILFGIVQKYRVRGKIKGKAKIPDGQRPVLTDLRLTSIRNYSTRFVSSLRSAQETQEGEERRGFHPISTMKDVAGKVTSTLTVKKRQSKTIKDMEEVL